MSKINFFDACKACDGGGGVLGSYVRNLRQEAKGLAQDHTDCKWWGEESNPARLAPDLMLLTTKIPLKVILQTGIIHGQELFESSDSPQMVKDCHNIPLEEKNQ